MDVGRHFIDVCLWTYKSEEGKVDKILPMHFTLGESVSCLVLRSRVPFALKLANPVLASLEARKLLLMAEGDKPCGIEIIPILSHGNHMLPHVLQIACAATAARVTYSIAAQTQRRSIWARVGAAVVGAHGRERWFGEF